MPLSQNTKWINPIWTEAWISPYIKVKCGGSTKLLQIADSIGYNRKDLSYDLNFKYPTSNNSVLAPFRKTFEMACAGPLTEITVGRKSSEVESEQERLILPESSLVLKF